MTLRSVLLKSLQTMCKESSFADYLAHESDFIDIFMQLLSNQLENLPNPIILNENADHPSSVFDLLSSNYGQRIEIQYEQFVDICNFMREILTTLYNEQRNTITWDEDEQINE